MSQSLGQCGKCTDISVTGCGFSIYWFSALISPLVCDLNQSDGTRVYHFLRRPPCTAVISQQIGNRRTQKYKFMQRPRSTPHRYPALVGGLFARIDVRVKKSTNRQSSTDSPPDVFHFTRATGRLVLASIAACGFRDLHIQLPASWEECLAIDLNTATRLLSSFLPGVAVALAENYEFIPIENLG